MSAKGERLAAIKARLFAEPPATTHDEAFKLLADVINAYEDEHSGVPYDPVKARTVRDGRIYPPQPDSERHSDKPGVRRYVTLGHDVLIGANGAIMFVERRAQIVDLSKPGADGKEIEP